MRDAFSWLSRRMRARRCAAISLRLSELRGLALSPKVDKFFGCYCRPKFVYIFGTKDERPERPYLIADRGRRAVKRLDRQRFPRSGKLRHGAQGASASRFGRRYPQDR